MIKFAKVLDVKSPDRGGSDLNAGIDFYIPNYSEEFVIQLAEKNKNNGVVGRLERTEEDGDLKFYIQISPHSQVNIPSGIKVILPEDKCLIGVNKSGVSTKYDLHVGAQLIDPNYRGQIHLNLLNNSDKFIRLKEGQKIVQFMEIHFYTDELGEIGELEYNMIPEPDSRGDKGFGEGTGKF